MAAVELDALTVDDPHGHLGAVIADVGHVGDGERRGVHVGLHLSMCGERPVGPQPHQRRRVEVGLEAQPGLLALRRGPQIGHRPRRGQRHLADQLTASIPAPHPADGVLRVQRHQPAGGERRGAQGGRPLGDEIHPRLGAGLIRREGHQPPVGRPIGGHRVDAAPLHLDGAEGAEPLGIDIDPAPISEAQDVQRGLLPVHVARDQQVIPLLAEGGARPVGAVGQARPPDDLRVTRGIGPQGVVVHRPPVRLTGGEAGVIEAAAVEVPGERGRPGEGDDVGQVLAGVHLQDPQRAHLVPLPRGAVGEQPAISRGVVPVEGGAPIAGQRVGIHERARRPAVDLHHEDRLLLRPLSL